MTAVMDCLNYYKVTAAPAQYSIYRLKMCSSYLVRYLQGKVQSPPAAHSPDGWCREWRGREHADGNGGKWTVGPVPQASGWAVY